MGSLPLPDLPPGAHRDLVLALHDLHHRAGWPSLRTLSSRTGVSHTTVSKAFSNPRPPSWGTVEVLVEAMAGDPVRFHDLWLAATAPTRSTVSSTAPRLAGRRAEVAALRRHLDTGAGLLLVTGEAGIGKTTLVSAAADGADSLVARGRCLPLSTEVPLLPVTDVLGAILAVEDGLWLKEALADCPRHVRSTLALVLPELEDGPPQPTDEFARQRLLSAITAVLGTATRLRPAAILLEDLHWADPTTLDVLEHLLTHAPGVRVVATLRDVGPDVPDATADRLARLRRLAAPPGIALAPLDLTETREQLDRLLGRAATYELVTRIHSRTGGNPLFTEQLATARPDELPLELAAVFEGRLAQLDTDAWAVVRTLGVADRPLPPDVLGAAAGTAAEQLVTALRDLSALGLLADARDPDQVELRHPVLAEVVRGRLVPGEAVLQHVRLAEALGSTPDAEAGEVARHWEAAGGERHEVEWRVAAAWQAHTRYAAHVELRHWLRAVELWAAGDDERLGIPLAHVLRNAMDAARTVGDFAVASTLAERAETVEADPADRAALLGRSGLTHCELGDRTRGLTMIAEALELHRDLPPSAELVKCLVTRAASVSHHGRFADAREDLARALQVADALDDATERRRVLNWASWFALAGGEKEKARSLSLEALALSEQSGDPFVEVAVAVNATDILLHLCAPVETVLSTASRALAALDGRQLTERSVAFLRVNVGEAHLRAGDCEATAAMVEGSTHGEPVVATYEVHAARAEIDAVRGRLEEALSRVEALDRVSRPQDSNWAESQVALAVAEYWSGHPRRAAARLDEALTFFLPTDRAGLAAPAAAWAARAAADAWHDSSPEERHESTRRLRARRAGAAVDPFGPDAIGVAAAVWHLVWRAELARLEGSEEVDLWTAAATGWDRLARPHEAGYCRWRAAQVALREGSGTVGSRLLARAARDARQHVPLTDAIARTATSVGAGDRR